MLEHLGIIMDGNRRWAKNRGLFPMEGHRAGYETLKNTVKWALAQQIAVLSVFAFSTENWKRADDEVGFLMDLLEYAFSKELSYFIENKIRIRVLGQRTRLRASTSRIIDEAERQTKDYTAMTLCVCFNYGGRLELVDAVKKILSDGIASEDVTEKTIQQYLYWPEMPDPDLVVRTSGEQRVSGFLTWQTAYTELFWLEKNWPDVTDQDLDLILADYKKRERRFGK